MKEQKSKLKSGLITREEVLDFYERIAPDIPAYRKKNSYYHELLTDLLRAIIPSDSRTLDVGCGQGDVLNALGPSLGVGVDLSPAMITEAKKRYPNLNFTVGDAEDMDIPHDAFDYILVSNTIGYLQDIQKSFASIRKYCSSNTKVVITHYNYLWEPVLKLAEKLGLKMPEPYQNWLSVDDTINLLELEGLEVIDIRQAILLPKRIPVVSSIVNRYLTQLPFFRRLSLVWTVVAKPVESKQNSPAYSCSVIVPARNERGNIEDVVKRIPDIGSHTEIVFVEGHSCDGTLDEIMRVKTAYPGRDIKVLTQDGDGKGDAVRKGFEHSSGEILMICDADLTVGPEELPKFYAAVASGKAEIVVGCRLVYQLEEESMRTLNLLGNKFFSLIFTWILGQRIKDTLCGTKVLFRNNYEKIRQERRHFGDLDPFGDFDLLFGAAKQKLKIMEIPVRYRRRTYGDSNIKRFRHGLKLLKMSIIGFRKLRAGN